MRGRLAFSLLGSWLALAALVQACSSDSNGTASTAGAGGSAFAGNTASGGTGTSPQAGSSNLQAGAATGGSAVGVGGASVTPTAGNGTGSSGGPPQGGGPSGPAVGAAQFGTGDLDEASDGATLTFQNIGKAGSYPSRRAAGSASCDIKNEAKCCLTTQQVTSDALTPWDQDLIVQLRGPIQVKQFVVYQPASANEQQWNVVSAWDAAKPTEASSIQFDGNATPNAKFSGTVGSQCVIDALTDKPFGCNESSVPYCDANAGGIPKNWGWAGSKLFVIAARMPMMGGNLIDAATACGQGTANNWYNAPWIGVSLGELVREDKFGPCNCYGSVQSPLDGKGCGQLNAFEVVNDNNDYQNFDLFSSNFFSYANNVGEGPCGKNCNVSATGPADLIDKSNSQPATKGGVTVAGMQAAHVAFRRPEKGYRYFLVLFDVSTRQVQLAIIHPSKLPAAASPLLPTLPTSITRANIDALLGMRLPG